MPVRAFYLAGGRLKSRILLVLLALCLLATPAWCAKTKRHAQTPAPPPPPPPAPLTPEQSPAEPPQVQYLAGQLTIVAPNSTLGDILRAVRRQTGASVDIPGNTTERVIGTFGPGPARDVLSSLLNGSHFNYLLVGSATNPNDLDRVILTSKSNEQAAQPGGPAITQARPGMAPPQPAEDQDMSSNDDSADLPTDAGDGSDDQGNQGQAEDQQQQQQQTPNPFGAQGVKTPEQLLQELQQRQQQIQQQQGVQNPQGFPAPQQPPRQP